MPRAVPPQVRPRQTWPERRTQSGQTATGVPTVAAQAGKPPKRRSRVFGFSADVGMPDGANLGLVVAPFDWARLTGAAGTNSAALGYRGGLSLIPMGWGPSFTFEVGHCDIAANNSLLKAFFKVPKWVAPYVQQLGYTYANGHLGFDYAWGGLTIFLHGGVSYLMATLRSPEPVVITDAGTNTNTLVTITRDGDVRAYTLSAKLGLVYLFGGP